MAQREGLGLSLPRSEVSPTNLNPLCWYDRCGLELRRLAADRHPTRAADAVGSHGLTLHPYRLIVHWLYANLLHVLTPLRGISRSVSLSSPATCSFWTLLLSS